VGGATVPRRATGAQGRAVASSRSAQAHRDRPIRRRLDVHSHGPLWPRNPGSVPPWALREAVDPVAERRIPTESISVLVIGFIPRIARGWSWPLSFPRLLQRVYNHAVKAVLFLADAPLPVMVALFPPPLRDAERRCLRDLRRSSGRAGGVVGGRGAAGAVAAQARAGYDPDRQGETTSHASS
jgi:hypothetical protein